jgi:predicted kinase
MRKFTRSRFRKKKQASSDTEQTGRIGQSRETFQGGAQPLQPNYYDRPPAEAREEEPEEPEAPAKGRMETETQPESLAAPLTKGPTQNIRPQQPQPKKAPRGVVVLTIGLPGSGKTTWYKRRGVTPLSSDILRSLLFDDITEQRYQSLVFSTLRSLLRARLIAKMPWNYVDATNLSPRERKQWIQMAKSFGYEVHAVYFDVPIDVCLERNARRDRRVPEDVLQRMASKLKPPTFDEGFAKIIVVRVKQREGGDTAEDGA